MKLFVAGLPLDMDDRELKAIFSDYGEVMSAKIITDKSNGYSRGFGFVEMVEETDAITAIKALNRATIEGKVITVRPAEYRPRGNRPTAEQSALNDAKPNRLI
jgi:cold-inducible RNA-binding protein